MKGLGLSSLSGARHDNMPPLLKTKTFYKKFGPAQNILGPVKGQGICVKMIPPITPSV